VSAESECIQPGNTTKTPASARGKTLKPVLRQTEIARTPCFRHKAEGGGGATRDFRKTFVHGSSFRQPAPACRKRLIDNRNFYSPIFQNKMLDSRDACLYESGQASTGG
jgi:hypothetical protein